MNAAGKSRFDHWLRGARARRGPPRRLRPVGPNGGRYSGSRDRDHHPHRHDLRHRRAPTATSGTAETTCLPDTGGLFASQAFQTIAAYGLLPAFPNTKHGIGEGHQANGANFDWQTFCSLGTKATLDNLFANALPSLGWKLTTPPANVAAACAWTGPRWWQGTTMLTWSYDGAAGNGSYFWSYTTCALATS